MAAQAPPPDAVKMGEVAPVAFDRSIVSHFTNLNQGEKCKACYIYLDIGYMDPRQQAFNFKTKSRTLDKLPTTLQEVPLWSYADFESEDKMLVPRKMYKDPFRPGPNILVFADAYERPEEDDECEYGAPCEHNTRPQCLEAMQKIIDEGEEPWFGIEQEYYLLDAFTNRPLGWGESGGPDPENLEPFHGATGACKAPGREIVESHYQACLYAGVKISGVNAEDAPGQWEYQVGPSVGIDAGDDVWVSRFILQRVCEWFKVKVTFDPKPFPEFPGLGGHTNYSTKGTRTAPGGWTTMQQHFEKLGTRHREHMKVYGPGNERRLVGDWDAADLFDFSWKPDSRDASIRVLSSCVKKDCGYYEDRRPAANMDPYLVTMMIVETTLILQDRRQKAVRGSKDRGSFKGVDLDEQEHVMKQSSSAKGVDLDEMAKTQSKKQGPVDSPKTLEPPQQQR